MKILEIEQPIQEGPNDPNIFKAIFLAGPPGAGKNQVVQWLGISNIGLKMQDIDHTLAFLNKGKAPATPDYARGERVTIKRQDIFAQNMLGLLINSTGRNYESLMGLNKQLKTAGYDTMMIYVDVDYDVAVNRIGHREQYATDPADKNRRVDLDYFKQAYAATKQNLDFYALMFGDHFALVTNNGNDTSLQHDLRIANKKVSRFLNKPLTSTAQSILAQYKTATS